METITRSFITMMLSVIFTGMAFAATGAEKCSYEKDKFCVEYFDNGNHSGEPTAIQTSAGSNYYLNADWGTNVPVEGLSRGYSVRYKGSFKLYEFPFQTFNSANGDLKVYIGDYLAYDSKRSPNQGQFRGSDEYQNYRIEFFDTKEEASFTHKLEERREMQASFPGYCQPSVSEAGNIFCIKVFGNKDLTGNLHYENHYFGGESFKFNWGTGPAFHNTKFNNFSVRAEGNFDFTENNYQFTVKADDGIRLYVDDQLVIDKWKLQGATTYKADVAMTAGKHNIKIEYFENGGNAVLESSWAVREIVEIPEIVACEPGQNEFCVDYYANMTQEGAPVYQERVDRLQKNWGAGSPSETVPKDKFSAKAVGNFNFAKKDYTFNVKADDGVRLWIDGVLHINAWKNQSATQYTTTVPMTAGSHLVQIDYYENGGNTYLSNSWSYARNVTVTADKDANRLNKARVYAFSGTKYLGKYATFDENGEAYIKDVPFGDVSYRVDYRGQHFTAPSADNNVSVDLSSFGFRDVTVSTSDADKLNKARVYVFDENDKYKSVYGNFNEEGNVTFFLPSNTYKYRVDYRGQWFTSASTADSVNVALADFGFRNVVVDGSADADKLNKKRVYVFNAEDKYQGVWAAFDETGKANLYLPTKSYKYRVDYRGQYFTPVSNAATVDASLASFGFRNVVVDGSANSDLLNKARVYVYDENDKYQSAWSSFDESGKATLYLANKSYKYRVDYRGQWFTPASNATTIDASLANFGFRDVVVDASANADLVNKARVYVFNEADKYQGVWAAFNESGKATFYLADKSYKYRVDYRGQWFTPVSNSTAVDASLTSFGFRDVVVDGSANAELLHKARVYVYDQNDKYQGAWTSFDESGKATFFLADKSYKFRVDYRGRWYTPASNSTNVVASLTSFGFRDVVVDGSANSELLNKARVYVFDENDKYQGIWTSFNESGKATFFLANKTYKYRVDYRGQWFTPASNSTAVDASLANFGFRNVVVDGSANSDMLNKARVYVYDENDKYQGVWTSFDATGKANFYLSSKNYKYRVDYRGKWFTPVTSANTVDASLASFGFRNVEVDGSANKDLLHKVRVYVFDEANKYQGVWSSFDENGKANFYLSNQNYKYRVDFRGQYFTAASNASKVSAALSTFGFKKVYIDGSTDKSYLHKARVYVFDENDKYQGAWASLDADGKAEILLANKPYKYRVDYRGRWFTKVALPSATGYWIQIKLNDFGFRNVVIDSGADKDKTYKKRVYAFDENNKYQGVWSSFDVNGKATMLLPKKDYKYRVDYRGQWFTPVSANALVNVKLSDFGFRDVTVASTLDKATLKGKRVYAYIGDKYQGVYGSFDVNGEVKMYLPTKEYKYRVDYIGQHFTQPTEAVEVNVALSDFGFHNVTIEASEKPEVLKGKRVYVFKGTKYKGIYGTFADGKVSFNLPSEDFRYRVDYDGQHYSPETGVGEITFNPTTHEFVTEVPEQSVEVTLVQGDSEVPISGAEVYILYVDWLSELASRDLNKTIFGTTDETGKTTLVYKDNLSKGVAYEYLGNIFYSNITDGKAKIVVPQSEEITLNLKVQDIGLSGVLVTVLNADGTSTGISFTTNAEGVAVVKLPPGSDYQLKLTYQGKEYVIGSDDYPDGNIDFQAVAGVDAPDYSSLTTLDKLISGIYKAIDLNADVLNISLGFDSVDPIPALETALQDARDAGMVIVAAAGNEVDQTPFYPAASPLTIAVGSVDSNLAVSHTKQTTWVDVFAPGVGIYSTNKDGDYSYFSGTSFAAPFVSALAAQMLAFSPNLTQSQILTKISTTGTNILTSEFQYPSMKLIDFETALEGFASSDNEVVIGRAASTSRFSPADNENIDSVDVTFTWPAIVGADSYDLWIMNADNGTLVKKVEDFTEFTYSTNELSSGNYAWWVRGNILGAVGAWSEANLFVKADVSILESAKPSFSWAAVPNATEYEVVIHKVDVSGNRLVDGYDLKHSKYWTDGPQRGTALFTNQYRSAVVYHPGFYEVWSRAKLSDDSMSKWIKVESTFEVPNVGQKLTEMGVSWSIIKGAQEYEVVVSKVDSDGNELVRGYDVENAKYWEEVGNPALLNNRFTPKKKYENGFYTFWVRAKMADGNLGRWVIAADTYEVNEVVTSVAESGFSWKAIPGSVGYEVVVNKMSADGVELINSYDGSASEYWERGTQTGTSVDTNYFTPSREYENGYYDIWARPIDAEGVLGEWIQVVKGHVVSSTKRLDQIGFTWEPVQGANDYDVVIHKVDAEGNMIMEGYDVDAAPYWEKGHKRALKIQTNFYKPARQYEPGFYDVWVRANTGVDTFSKWVKLHDKVEIADQSQGIRETGYSWKLVQNSARYEVVVHKVDESGEVLVSGYDIDAAPLWGTRNLGTEAKYVATNWHIPREYEAGFYQVWVRAQLLDGTTTAWVKLHDKLSINGGSSVSLHEVVITLDEIDSAVDYEVVVGKLDESGNEIIRGYDIDAAPFWDEASNKDTAIHLNSRVYRPKRAYEPGRYLPWYRAKRADGSMSKWYKARQFDVEDTNQKETEVGFTWAPVADAIGYEFVANKIENGKIVVDGYDSEHTPFWSRGHKRGSLLTHNYYIPKRKYEPGSYRLWYRAVFANGSFGKWLVLNSNYEVEARVLGVDYNSFSWSVNKKALSYEVVVNKTDAAGNVLWRGYDVDNAPFWNRGHLRGEGVVTNYFTPQRVYEAGYYEVWYRAIYADDVLAKWIKLDEVFEYGEPNSSNVNFTWAPVVNAEAYEVVIHKTDETGEVLVKGYDIDAAPWWEESGVREGNAVTLTTNHYSPTKSYDKGFYVVWVRAKVSGVIGKWIKAYPQFEVK
ncbi:MAG: S8 family serine peptidase [Candidatus Cloacimonetes bacterium]|nr:S8 family serine peptidase [Candidatus Cloacimonadota bacterium]